MKKANMGMIVLTMFIMVAWSSFLIGGCGGDGGSDTNPFVWPKLEYKTAFSTGLDHPIAIVMDRNGGSSADTKYWYICNQGSVANSGFITRVRYDEFVADAGDVQWVAGLNYPTGMALSEDNRLVVAEGTNVVVINTRTGVIERRIPVTGASNLRDVVVRDLEDRYYVSDFDNRQIFRGPWANNNNQVYTTSSAMNNLDALYLTDDEDYIFAGTTDKIFSVYTGDAGQVDEFITVPDNYDVTGLAKIYGTMFIISSRTTSEIFAVDTLSKRQFLAEITDGTPGYIYVDITTDNTYYLYVPTIEGGEVKKYRITADYDA